MPTDDGQHASERRPMAVPVHRTSLYSPAATTGTTAGGTPMTEGTGHDSSARGDDGHGDSTRDDGGFEDFSHTDDQGRAQMVDVGGKDVEHRCAVASGRLDLRAETIEAIRADAVTKGDVLATARIGAIQAVKRTWESIPLCHQIPITNAEARFALEDRCVALEVEVETTGRTGCEMEAIQGVTTGLNVVVDMVKALEKADDGGYPRTAVRDVTVDRKEVGRKG